MEHADITSQFPNLAQVFVRDMDFFPQNLASRHERVAKKVDVMWGTAECVKFLDGLMLSDRPDRAGFAFDVIRELFALKERHDVLFPLLVINVKDPFATVMTDVMRVDDEKRRSENESKRKTSARDGGGGPASIIDRRPAKAPAVMKSKAADAPLPQIPPDQKEAEPSSPVAKEREPWPQVAELDQLRRIMAQRARGERVPQQDKRQMTVILQQHVVLDDKHLETALKIQSLPGKKREPIGKVFLQMGVVSEEMVTRSLCCQYGVLMVNLQRFQILPDVMRMITPDMARKARVIPVAVIDDLLFMAVENPFSFDQREYLAFLTKKKIELVMAAGIQITQRLVEYGQVRSVQQGDEEFRHLAKRALSDAPLTEVITEEQEQDTANAISQDDASIVGLVNKIISDAAEIGASDIHIESYQGEPLAYIRFRRDGRMEEYSQYSASYHRAVVSRIKIMSSLDISEKRMAQDGKISFIRPGKERLDLRVATIPTLRGIENVNIRLLHAGEPIPIEQLKMCARDLGLFRRLILRPYGLILVCGPTGSGKTTTLHSALRELNTAERKIWTAEDPVEIVQKKICQVQVNPKIGWTFATALRSFLRADPDVIMIGEMRDQETAKIALEASMTGHVVLSTLHTNSAAETAARLLDLEVDPFNLADALVFILAQRLARTLCPRCAVKVALTPEETEELATEYYYSANQRIPSMAERELMVLDWTKRLAKGEALSQWQPKGCAHCSGEGYKGRVALFELMEVTPQIRELILRKSSAAEYQRIAVGQGMRTLKQDGIEKALLGLTDMTQIRGACN